MPSTVPTTPLLADAPGVGAADDLSGPDPRGGVAAPGTHEAGGDTCAPQLTSLTVLPWSDPHLAHSGFDPRSAYVERFWLGVLGPSATWLLRRFARGFEERPGGFRIRLADTARALGLGEGTGRNSMVVRTIDRACQFGMARQHGADQLYVRTHLPPLSERQLRRLPDAVRVAHDRWMSAASAPSVPAMPGTFPGQSSWPHDAA